MSFCKNCGHQIAEDAPACEKCGYPQNLLVNEIISIGLKPQISQHPQMEPSSSVPQTSPKKQSLESNKLQPRLQEEQFIPSQPDKELQLPSKLLDNYQGGLHDNYSPKSQIILVLLCIFLGILGVHRFYIGRVISGLLMLLTLGGFGFWVYIDMIFIIVDDMTDMEGRKIKVNKLARVLGIIYLLIITIIFLYFLGSSG
jgi:TM2 domain-containing membrane protein YozV